MEVDMEFPKLPEKDIISYDYAGIPIYAYTADQMQDYARQAVMMEREACAKLCDSDWNGDSDTYDYSEACNDCASAIRART